MGDRIQDAIIRQVLEVTCRTPPPTYSPSEDSFLMLDALEGTVLKDKQVLDVGTGSGVLGLVCAIRGAHVTVSDSDASAIEHAGNAAKLLRVELKGIVSDMFTDVPGRFNLILFNPPYLPSQDYKDKTVDGGALGRNLINRFLDGLPNHLQKGGEALLLISSLNNPKALFDARKEFEFLTLKKRALFFEELQVLRLRLRDDLSR